MHRYISVSILTYCLFAAFVLLSFFSVALFVINRQYGIITFILAQIPIGFMYLNLARIINLFPRNKLVMGGFSSPPLVITGFCPIYIKTGNKIPPVGNCEKNKRSETARFMIYDNWCGSVSSCKEDLLVGDNCIIILSNYLFEKKYSAIKIVFNEDELRGCHQGIHPTCVKLGGKIKIYKNRTLRVLFNETYKDQGVRIIFEIREIKEEILKSIKTKFSYITD